MQLGRNAERLSFAREEVAFGSNGPGHESEQKRIQSAMKATQAHGHAEVHVETLSTAGREQNVMHEMKAAARAEANEEDDEVKSASSNIKGPVPVRAIEVPDY